MEIRRFSAGKDAVGRERRFDEAGGDILPGEGKERFPPRPLRPLGRHLVPDFVEIVDRRFEAGPPFFQKGFFEKRAHVAENKLAFEGDRIEWMTALGSNFHGLLGWTLLVLIVGHAGMAIWHRRAGDQDALARMAPRLARTR